MGFKVKPDGTIECDSPQEALDLRSLMMAHKDSPTKAKRQGKRRASTKHESNGAVEHAASGGKPDLSAFLGNLSENGVKVVRALAGSARGLTTDDLAAKVGQAPTALPPLMRSVHTQAIRSGFPDLVDVMRQIVDGKPKSLYRLNHNIAESVQAALKKQHE